MEQQRVQKADEVSDEFVEVAWKQTVAPTSDLVCYDPGTALVGKGVEQALVAEFAEEQNGFALAYVGD